MVTYPQDWTPKQLKDLGYIQMCRRIFQSQTKAYGVIPFYKISTFGGTADAYISQEIYEKYKTLYPYPEKGDVLISATGTIGKTVVFDGKDSYFQDSNIVWLKVDKESIDRKFLWWFYRSYPWEGLEGTTIQRLYNSIILKTEIHLPKRPEQEEIARTLSQFDTYIADLSELIEKKRDIRDGALEDLTSGRTRLGGFKGDWEIIELGKKCEITSSKRVFEKEWTKSGITFLRTRDIASFHSGEEQNDKLYISEETYKEKVASSGEPQKGDLLVTGVGTIGLPFLIDTDEKIYFKDGNILWIKKNEMLTSEWLYFLFLSKAAQRQIADNSGFTTVGTFTIKNAKKLRVPMPPISEQKAITSVLISMNDEIKALETERDKIIQIREGAMDDLLTGRVRLSV